MSRGATVKPTRKCKAQSNDVLNEEACNRDSRTIGSKRYRVCIVSACKHSKATISDKHFDLSALGQEVEVFVVAVPRLYREHTRQPCDPFTIHLLS